MRIEFVGLMGSGKSTICKELLGVSNIYIDYTEALIHSHKRYYYNKGGINILYSNIITYTFKYNNNIFKTLMKKWLLNEDIMTGSADPIMLLKYIEYNSKSHGGDFNFIKRLRYYLTDLGMVMLLVKYFDKDDKIIIQSESLVQRIVLFAIAAKNPKKFLTIALELIPLSDVIVFVEGDVNEFYKRMVKRGKQVSRFKFKYNDIEKCKNIAKMIIKEKYKNIKVIEVSGMESPNLNANRIHNDLIS